MTNTHEPPTSLLRGSAVFRVDRHDVDPRYDGAWPRRLRLAIADYLAEPAAGRDEHQAKLNDVRLYHQLIGMRSHTALRQQVLDGWWLGRAPYGYQRTAHQTTTGTGRRVIRYRLAVDPARAPTVPLIFGWTERHGLTTRQIAGRLAADPSSHPLPTDGVSSQPWPWTPDVIGGILTNPAYLGYSVWARTHHGRRLDPTSWTWSAEPTHPALVKRDVFWAIYSRRNPRPEAGGGWDDEVEHADKRHGRAA